jgi:hypothetical protein
MLPWLIMAAASVLAQNQKRQQAQAAMMLDQYKQNAIETGGSTRMADVLTNQQKINAMSTDYSNALMGMVGQSSGGGGGDSSDDDDEDKVKPRSGVRLRMEDF